MPSTLTSRVKSLAFSFRTSSRSFFLRINLWIAKRRATEYATFNEKTNTEDGTSQVMGLLKIEVFSETVAHSSVCSVFYGGVLDYLGAAFPSSCVELQRTDLPAAGAKTISRCIPRTKATRINEFRVQSLFTCADALPLRPPHWFSRTAMPP